MVIGDYGVTITRSKSDVKSRTPKYIDPAKKNFTFFFNYDNVSHYLKKAINLQQELPKKESSTRKFWSILRKKCDPFYIYFWILHETQNNYILIKSVL